MTARASSRLLAVLTAGVLSAGIYAAMPVVQVHADEAPAVASSSQTADASAVASEAGYTKDQVVYVQVDARGHQGGVYVMNELRAPQTLQVSDAGAYTTTLNLTDGQVLDVHNDAVSMKVTGDSPFRYQGALPADMATPWLISVDYELDGQPVDPADLGGATGHLKMRLSIEPNEACEGPYADNYLIQAVGMLKGDEVSVFDAPGATPAKVGNDTQLTYMFFPKSAASCEIEADVCDFTFDGWQIVGVPLALQLDVDVEDVMETVKSDGGDSADTDASAKTDETVTTDATTPADDNTTQDASDEEEEPGLEELIDGITELNDGAHAIKDGTSDAQDALNTLGDNSEDLRSGAADLKSGADKVSDGVETLKTSVNDVLIPGAEALASGSSEYLAGITSAAADSRSMAEQIDVDTPQAAVEAAAAAYVQTCVATVMAGGDPTTNEDCQVAYAAMQEAMTTMVGAQAEKAARAAVADALDSAALSYAPINDGVQGVIDEDSDQSVYALKSGVSALGFGSRMLSKGAGTLSDGVVNYTEGVDQLKDSHTELIQGTIDLADGTQKLADATVDLDSKISDKVSEKVEGLLNPEFVLADFANGETSAIRSVQFVYMTDPIEIPETTTQTTDNAADDENQDSFIDKFLHLFTKE